MINIHELKNTLLFNLLEYKTILTVKILIKILSKVYRYLNFLILNLNQLLLQLQLSQNR